MDGWLRSFDEASVVVRLQAALVPWGFFSTYTESAKLRVRCLGKYS